MKRLYRALLVSGLISTFTTPSSHAEEIYKRVDEKGVPSFSDTKTEGAEKIVVEPVKIQSVPTPVSSVPVIQSAEPTFEYKSLAITTPEDNATLRDPHKIKVEANLKPALQDGHRIEFLDNGQPIQPAARASSIELLNFDRGTHALTSRIIDKDGKVLKTSNPVTVHIQRTVVVN